MLKKLSLIMVMSLGCLIGAGMISNGAYAAGGNSQYSLEGAKYRLYTNEACTVEARDASNKEAVLTTDANGNANTLSMNPGTYYAKEIKAGKGYQLDKTVYKLVVTSSNNAKFTSKEPPAFAAPEFMVFKTDKTGAADYTGLTGALFTVKYYDVAEKTDISASVPKDEWTFKSVKKDAPSEAPEGSYWAGFDWQRDDPVSTSRQSGSVFYKDGNGKRVLPLGWFTIEEVKAPSGFKRIDKVCYGHVFQDESGNAKVEIEGAADDGRLHAKTLTFENEPVNTYIKKTDSASQKNISGARLQLLRGSEVIDEWVSTAEEHKIKSLGSGSYTLREISAPYGYDVSDDVTFTVSDNQDTHAGMENKPVTLSTSAADSSTGKHIGSISTTETITDSVHLTGLYPGRQYRVTGKLMDKSTGLALKDSAGKEISSSREFTAASDVMDVEVKLTTDSTSFRPGTKAVVFEKLQRVSKVHDEKVPLELQKHEDLNDAAQTISYPVISTKAAMGEGNREVKDAVEYEGLLPDENYMLKGWLVDTGTGEKVPGSDGNVRFSSGKETSGRKEMILKADKYEGVKGHSMTAFEELYIIRSTGGKDTEVLIAAHRDRKAKSQTVMIFQDLRMMKNVTGNLGDTTKKFEYTAEFAGLVPGQAYEVEGDDEKTFNADPSGRAGIPFALADGQEVRIKQLPKGAQYRITEKASDHVAGFKVYSEDMADKGAKIVLPSGSNGNDAAKPLSTELETVDQFDGTVVILWENNRDLATVTAVQSYSGIWACGTAMAFAGLLMLILKRKKYREEQEEMK